ncbi:phage head closure protein [Undibacterium sp. Ji50W]|uniref:phage head closure protein n=1 Tax=Undibacterium sp. Ji50W TaxID=3413041 RepID=UPI003BEF73DC
MSIGSRRKRVTLQNRSATLDEFGQRLNTWVDVATVWAAIEPISGNERLHGLQVNSEISSKVETRYRPEFADPTVIDNWRLLYGTRKLNIKATLNEDERNRLISFLCSEGLNDGQ